MSKKIRPCRSRNMIKYRTVSWNHFAGKMREKKRRIEIFAKTWMRM